MKSALVMRSKLIHAVRSFFIDRGFVEVETPVRIPVPALELHIDAEPSGNCYLRTSPELHMKRLLSAGYERIFQIGSCFRRGERGRLHNPEFTMLEWYRLNADYDDILLDTKALVSFLAEKILNGTSLVYNGNKIELMPIWDCISVEEAFLLYAGWNPVMHFDTDRFNIDLIEKVEPKLSHDHPVVLKDYPAEVAALARRKTVRPEVAERWELYIGGMELVNAFSELTDPIEQRKRFEECSEERRKAGRETYQLDEEFLRSLEHGIPAAGGAALGIDRLVMLMAGAEEIDKVRLFCQ
ncbi:MAG: EF-P lysine aminoacylase EpmA [Kiritimatiellae bacterium]|nr:EF-P lysine aminoacylase EpmA [Kiritimatiellia bacterium]MDD5522349.1 EF-P lysine aminoacylase EpmA [Kiritimatiellia bacterium]